MTFEERLAKARKFACGWTSRWAKLACPGLEGGPHYAVCDSLTFQYDDELQKAQAGTDAHAEEVARLREEVAALKAEAKAREDAVFQTAEELSTEGRALQARAEKAEAQVISLQGDLAAARTALGRIATAPCPRAPLAGGHDCGACNSCIARTALASPAATPPVPAVEPAQHWRVGRKLGRTLYIGETFVGLMDSPFLAEKVVATMNGDRAPAPAPEPPQAVTRAPEFPDTAQEMLDALCCTFRDAGGVGCTHKATCLSNGRWVCRRHCNL